MKILINIYVVLKILAEILFYFTVTYFSLKCFMDFASSVPILDKDLLMPTIVLSSAMVALFNYKETIKNNKNSIEWKQREQTILMFEKFDLVLKPGMEVVFNRPKVIEWIRNIERNTHKDSKTEIYFDDALVFFKHVSREIRDNKNELEEVRNSLHSLLMVMNKISVQYQNELLDKELVKKLFYLMLVKQSFVMMAILKSFYRDEFLEPSFKLLDELNIDYKIYRNRSWNPTH